MIEIITLSKLKEKNVSSIDATFKVDGNLVPLRVNEVDHKEKYQAIEEVLADGSLLLEEAAEKLYSIMSPKARIRQAINDSHYLSKELTIEGNVIYFGEHRLESTLAEHILSLLDEEKAPKNEKLWRSYLLFLDNLHQNANKDIREQLFRWMDYENRSGNAFAITDDGCLVGYKGCEGTVLEPRSVFSGFAIVDGEEMNGQIPNKVGSVISMPRSAVEFNPEVGCSTGLHVGTRDYATRWAPILLLVKVNPRDVVSVPYESDSQKMRVCEYTILEVTDASAEHKYFYETEEDEDYESYEDYEDYEEDLEGDREWEEWEESLKDISDSDPFNDEEDSEEDCLFNDYNEEEVNADRERVLNVGEAVDTIKQDDEDPYGYIYLEYEKNGVQRANTGEVLSVYDATFRPGKRSGIVIYTTEGEHKHIKLDNVTYYEILKECDVYNCTEEDQEDQEGFEDEADHEKEGLEGNELAQIITALGVDLINSIAKNFQEEKKEESIYEELKGKRVLVTYKGDSLNDLQTFGSIAEIDSEKVVVSKLTTKVSIPMERVLRIRVLN